MAKTVRSRVKEFRDRKKQELSTLPDSTYPFLQTPFFEWKEGQTEWDSAEYHFHAAGYEAPIMNNDSGPRSVDGEVELTADGDCHPYAGFEGSIGRAEALVDHLIAAATNVAIAINTYKKEEITARIAEIENTDLSNPEVKRKAFADIVRLHKMLERLDRMNRISIYEYKIKGI
jgi:hypothetical protein